MGRWLALLFWACLALAQEPLTLQPMMGGDGEPLQLRLPAAARSGGILVLHMDGRLAAQAGPRPSIACTLLTADEGWYRTTADHQLLPGKVASDWRLPMDGAHWAGPDGPLDSDALLGLQTLTIQAPAGLDISVEWIAAETAAARWLQAVDAGPVDIGPWYRWRFRLLGPPPPTGAVVEVQLGNGAIVPATPARQMQTEGHGNRGPALWELRLRPEEVAPGPVSVAIREAASPIWQATIIWAPASQGHKPFAAADGPWPIPSSPDLGGLHTVIHNGTRQALRAALPVAIAPVLWWREDYTGYRGLHAQSHPMLAQLDAVIAEGVSDIDLLPTTLAARRGPFRFGLAPWHHSQGGPWNDPQDVLAEPTTVDDLVAHAIAVIARCRAAPGLLRWRAGLDTALGTPEQGAVYERLVAALATAVQRYDGRPLHVAHPAAIPFAKTDGTPWESFELGPGAWQSEPRSAAIALDRTQASHGQASLRCSLGGGDGEAVRLVHAVDADWWNLERLLLDVRHDGPGGISWYAFHTDEHHRFYQQRLAWHPDAGRWRTLAVDFGDESAWQPVGHDTPWRPDTRRRIRTVGLLAVRYLGDGQVAQRTRIGIDRIRRVGWPDGLRPHGSLELRSVPPDSSAVWQPYEVAFALHPQVDNPFDPADADVVAEVEGPEGFRQTWPAFWFEPMTLVTVDGEEQVQPSGPGHWRWRYAFHQPGTWRWRLKADLAWRDETVSVRGDWHTVTVTTGDDPLLPVERSSDPMWWQTTDGAWFYPLGLNLRSPGDDRQDVLLRDGAALRSTDFERMGTAAYERWLTKLSAAGGNFARVWMSPWWCGLEWHRDWDGFNGLGRYNQAMAARLDRIVEIARSNRIYLQVELQNHGMTSEHVDEQWQPDPETNQPGSPYNAVNGGPCREAADFFRDPEAWNWHRNRLRYTVARWGANSHLMAWVLSSEMEFTGAWWEEASRSGNAHRPTTEAWVRKSLAWFAENDRYARPVSLHFSHPWRAEQLWKLDGLGFNYSNAYTGFQTEMGALGGRRAGLASAFRSYLLDHFPPWELGRPTMIGEWGGHWMERDADKLAAEFRTGLWMQAVLPYGGNTGFWWWLWVDGADRWQDFRPIATFLDGEDPRGADLRPVRPRIEGGSTEAWIFGARGADRFRLYAWLRGLDRELVAGDPEADAGVAQLTTMQPGSRWRWQRFDTGSGQVTAQGERQADDQGVVLLPLGALTPDAAYKVDRLPAP